MFGQILAPVDEVEDPDDDSQWDGSKLKGCETVEPWLNGQEGSSCSDLLCFDWQ